MKRVIFIVAVATLVLTLATGAAFAGKGPKDKDPPKPKVPETLVTDLAGTITGKVCANEYTFEADDKVTYPDSLILDCGPAWYQKVELEVGAAATVTGELEKCKDGIQTELGVYSVTQNGTKITVREGPGKPPWAGGPGGHGQPDDNCDD